MTTPALHPDAVKAKYDLLKRWRDTETGRRESLGAWKVTRLDDGTLMVSARVSGPHPEQAFTQFVDRQALYMANRMDAHTGAEDQMPAMDVTDPARTAAVWRTGGMWVEIWHPVTHAGSAEAPRPDGQPSQAPQAAPIPAAGTSRRTLLSRPGGRLPFTRRNKTPKETPAA
jgi:hypothetical protein